MKQQERKVARRQRRFKRRKERDSLLISNAFLRESVAQYERSIKIAEAVAATQKRITNGGRASDEEAEEDDHSNGSSNESDYSGEDEATYSNTEEKETQDITKETNSNNSNDLDDLDDLNDLNDLNDSNDNTTPLSRPGTADENGTLVTITETKRVSNVDEGTLNGMASLGMALQPANAKVGDPFKYDSDQDSDEFEDTNESINETKSQNQNKKRNGKSSSSSKKSREKKMLLSNWGFAPPGGTDIFDEMMGSGDGLLIEDDGELKRKMHMDALSVPVIPDAPSTRRNNTESKNNENGEYSKRRSASIA